MIGVRLGSWVIEAEIGRGGMGTVYRASRAPGNTAGPEHAAVKVLAAELAVAPGFQQRFQREIEILQKLDHPAIVRFYESGVDRSRYWYAMEYVPGPSFEELRDLRGRISWTEAMEMAWQVAPALKHAHDRGVIHRDLKPSNLLRMSDPRDPSAPGLVKLTDFGIASLFASPHLTVTGGIIGTPEFLSPEQAAGKPATKRSDLYSLGIVLYALITGETPFTGEALELLHKHRYAQFDRPARIVPEMPSDFDEIICQLLEKDPDRRMAEAGVLFRKLDSLRRKLARLALGGTGQVGKTPVSTDKPGNEPGPATFAGQFVRQHLEEERRGRTPLQQLFNHPAVIVVLFILCLGALVWTFWPVSSGAMYARGAALMASEDPADWEKAWDRHLGPLTERFPNHPFKEEVEEFRVKVDGLRSERSAARQARLARKLSEAHWFFEKGRRERLRGDEGAARTTWESLIDAFEDVPSERPWAARARQELARVPVPDEKRLVAVKNALKSLNKLKADGEKGKAKRLMEGLRTLYAADPEALGLIGKE